MDPNEPVNELEDEDFANQMQLLIEEAKHQTNESPAISTGGDSLEKTVEGLSVSVANLQKLLSANSAILEKLDADSEKREKVTDSVTRRESVNQQMFDALYEEMKGYKDSFLMEALFKPVVRDLITLYDDTVKMHGDVAGFVALHEKEKSKKDPDVFSYLKNTVTHLDHMIHFLIELMERMGVTKMDQLEGRFDKNKQRVLSVELVDSLEEDGIIVSSMRPGFIWRDRIVRPEEVIIKRYKEMLKEPIKE